MTIHEYKRSLLILDLKQQAQIKGGNGDNTSFLIIDDIDAA